MKRHSIDQLLSMTNTRRRDLGLTRLELWSNSPGDGKTRYHFSGKGHTETLAVGYRAAASYLQGQDDALASIAAQRRTGEDG